MLNSILLTYTCAHIKCHVVLAARTFAMSCIMSQPQHSQQTASNTGKTIRINIRSCISCTSIIIIPATLVGTERAFSLTGVICSERRNTVRLMDSVFEALLLAKTNNDPL